MSAVDVLPLSPPATSSGYRKRTLPLFATKTTTTTPDDSPACGLEGSSQNSKKKVEFSDLTDILHPPVPDSSALLSVKLPPPSRDGQITIKSILKPTLQDDLQGVGFDGSAEEKLSLNESMESVVQQLARNDNAEAIDAYQILSSTIRAYDEIPDEAVLKIKFNAISKQIKHHLACLERPDPQPTDVNLVISALKVLVVLVWNPNLSPLLTDEIRAFILDRAIVVVAEHTAPKSVIVHYLHLLATQNFRPQLLASNSRASRLIEALQGLHGNVKGNGVVSERLLVYQKLLDQARPVMKAKASLWVEHMLSALVSNISDTRKRALDLARTTCQAFPTTSSISGSVRMALDLKQESGKTLGAMICRRLERMITGKDDAIQVPQIWAVVLLLCNNLSMRIDAWQSLKEWLMVLQQCFNGSDAALRQQANSAWNRFVYIARPYEASESLVSMLAKPLSAQLNRIVNDKSSRASHVVSISSYCNLLYYAFRPASSNAQYNRAWNEYIVKFMRSSFFDKSSGNADIAARIFMSLLWDAKTSTKIWNENRAHDNRLVEPEELPTIDCKWSRARCSHIMEIFQLLFRYGSWGFPSSSDQAYVSKAWRHFLKAIQEASSKEIKISNETRMATTSVLNFLGQLWQSKQSSREGLDEPPRTLSLEALTTISRAAVFELGVSRILDVSEAESDALNPAMYEVIFDAIKIGQKDEGRPQGWTSKYFSILNHRLEQDYGHETDSGVREESVLLDAVCRVLSSTPPGMVEECLDLLGPGLGLWLKDERARLTSKAQPQAAESYEGCAQLLQRLAKAFSSAIAKASARSLVRLDAFIASTLLSSHATVVNEIVSVWNAQFASQDDLKLGRELQHAIGKLLPYVEIYLPSGYSKDDKPRESQPAPQYLTQTHDIKQVQVKDFSRLPEAPEITSAATSSRDKKLLDTPQPDRPKSKSRNKDSQLEFVPIYSSSPPAQAHETQFMTAHQIEVRDRQREETAVTFPDLRSSPRPHSRRSESRESVFAKRISMADDRPATPVLPDHEALDGDAQPSPTPKSRVQRAVMDIEVPSSPPSMQDALDAMEVSMEEISSPLLQPIRPNASAVQANFPLEVATIELESASREIVPEEPQCSDVETRYLATSEEHHDEILADAVQLPARQDMIVTEPELVPAHSVERAGESLPSPPPPRRISRVATPLKPGSSAFNTDELNELSASQLENDLDWSHVLEGLTPPDEDANSPCPFARSRDKFEETLQVPDKGGNARMNTEADPEMQAATDEHEESEIAPLQKKRKRPQSGYAERKKRRKSSRSVSRALSSQSSYIKQDETEVSCDSIAVNTSSGLAHSSSPIQPEEAEDLYVTSQTSSNLQIGKSLQRPSGTLHGLRQGEQQRRSSRRSSLRLSVPVTPEVELPALLPRAVIPVVEVTLPTSDTAKADSVLANLQAVLDQVKKAPSQALDLRAIDELCFQIRYHAQAAARVSVVGAAIGKRADKAIEDTILLSRYDPVDV